MNSVAASWWMLSSKHDPTSGLWVYQWWLWLLLTCICCSRSPIPNIVLWILVNKLLLVKLWLWLHSGKHDVMYVYCMCVNWFIRTWEVSVLLHCYHLPSAVVYYHCLYMENTRVPIFIRLIMLLLLPYWSLFNAVFMAQHCNTKFNVVIVSRII